MSDYANLSCTDSWSAATSPPLCAGTPNTYVNVIPVYGASGYDTLVKAPCYMGGYAPISDAYPQNCTRFTTRMCQPVAPCSPCHQRPRGPPGGAYPSTSQGGAYYGGDYPAISADAAYAPYMPSSYPSTMDSYSYY